MSSSFELAVSALSESIIRDRCGTREDGGARDYDSVSRFLLRTHAGMPDYLRVPLASLTLAFDFASLPATGRTFHCLPHARRAQQIDAWRSSRLGFRRDLIKFYETLAIFGWYSQLYDMDYTHGNHAGNGHADGR